MLTIVPSQLLALNSAARARASKALVDHVERFFPKSAKLAGGQAVGHLVETCLVDADALGVVGQRDLLCLLSVQMYCGTGFRRDPQCAGFAAILDRTDVASASARIHRCWREAMEFDEWVAGKDREHRRAALERLAGAGLARIAADHAPLGEAQADAFLAHLWPQKHELLQQRWPGALNGLMRQALAAAQRLGPPDRGRVRTMLALGLVFGTGFDVDPILAPLHAALTVQLPMKAAGLASADAFISQLAASSH